MKTALFSGIITAFLALSLPDLQNRTTSLTPSLVVNILWLLTLVISVSSALNATLFQVFQGTAQLPHRRRSTIWKFMKECMMAQAVGLSILPTLLNISFYSFFASLVATPLLVTAFLALF